jgi:hypothetical protein
MAATGTITICHPKDGETIHKPYFPAYGKTEGDVGHLKGVLKDNQGKIAATGNPLKDGRHWVIAFEGVPPGEYTLEVSGVGAKPATSRFRVDPILIVEKAEKKAGKPRVPELLTTGDPPPNSTVGPSFVASGNSDQPYAVSGQMINGSGTYNGTTLQGPPDSSTWYVQFTGVPAGTGYTLTVSDTEGYASQTPNLTVTPPA